MGGLPPHCYTTTPRACYCLPRHQAMCLLLPAPCHHSTCLLLPAPCHQAMRNSMCDNRQLMRRVTVYPYALATNNSRWGGPGG